MWRAACSTAGDPRRSAPRRQCRPRTREGSRTQPPTPPASRPAANAPAPPAPPHRPAEPQPPPRRQRAAPPRREARLPQHAATGIARTDGVQRVTATAGLARVKVFRTDQMPGYRTGGVEVRATEPSLLDTLDGRVATGVFLNTATTRYPVVVLGHDAASVLGINRVDPGTWVWLGGHWFTVAGVLHPFELTPEIDRAALIGLPVAADYFGFDGHPTRLYVRADTDRTSQVATMARP